MTKQLPPAFNSGQLIPVLPFPELRPEMQFICNVPAGLGKPTGLEVRRDKIVCHTESGIDMIISKPRGPNG